MADHPTLTAVSSIPIAGNQNALNAGPRGPLLTQDRPLFDKPAHLNREHILERMVYANGFCANGTLQITGDISRFNGPRPATISSSSSQRGYRSSTARH